MITLAKKEELFVAQKTGWEETTGRDVRLSLFSEEAFPASTFLSLDLLEARVYVQPLK